MIAPLFSLLALAPAPLRCVIFGGGPEPTHNQVAIESNVRYVHSLLSKRVDKTVLFADGSADSRTVQFLDTRTNAQKAIRTLFGDGPGPAKGEPFLQYRKPNIPRRDGPTNAETITGVFDKLASEGEKASPLLLYFTGHGSPGRGGYDNNQYDLWNGGALTTTTLAGHLTKLPETRPITVVMVQCFSGSFGNLLFEGGVPSGDLARRPICGFFATVKERQAAGCTPEVEEEEYHDFTSYFFAALSGKDRLGRKVAPPDYNKDGKVGMDEALAWTQINEESIDVPVATSDVFLRRFVPMDDDVQLTEESWSSVVAAASPAQKAALEGLSEKLGEPAQSEDRIKNAYTRFQALRQRNLGFHSTRISGDVQQRYQAAREKLVGMYSGLGNRRASVEEWKASVSRATDYLESNPGELADLVKLSGEIEAATAASYKKDIEDARWFRFIRIVKSIVLEQRLRKSGDAIRIGQLETLRKLESQNPLR